VLRLRTLSHTRGRNTRDIDAKKDTRQKNVSIYDVRFKLYSIGNNYDLIS